MKKMTIAEKYDLILEKTGDLLTDELKGFLIERKEMALAKNANRKPTKVQEANADTKVAIVKAMEKDRLYTVTELMKSVPACAEMTNQKVSALVRQLIADGAIKRTESKGRAYFSLV